LLTKRDEITAARCESGCAGGRNRGAAATFPDRRHAGKLVANHQPVTLAAMEGLFESQQGAPLAILGQPDVEKRKLGQSAGIPNMLIS